VLGNYLQWLDGYNGKWAIQNFGGYQFEYEVRNLKNNGVGENRIPKGSEALG
jgi:hypothetical protein